MMAEDFLLDYSLVSNVRAFSTRRSGGVSVGSYSSFNITNYCGDNAEDVAENRRRLCDALSISDEKLILPHQTHSACCKCVNGDFFQMHDGEKSDYLEGVDAVFTQERGVCIGVSTADCIPILVCDDEATVVAAIHAGWRGTVQRIVEKTIGRLSETCCISSDKLCAVIGPGIGPEAFEVGDEVYEAFGKEFNMNGISKRIGDKWHIDLWAANYEGLLQAGLNVEKIKVAGICTYTNHHEFFSARRLGLHSGRIFSGIMIQD